MRTISDSFDWSKMEVCGLDQVEVFVLLDNGKMIGIPWISNRKALKMNSEKIQNTRFIEITDSPNNQYIYAFKSN